MKRRASFATLALSLATVPGLAQIDLDGASAALGLERASPVQVLFEDAPLGHVYASVVIGGEEIELNLRPASVLSEGFQLLEQRADGSFVQVPHSEPATYRGFAPELGGVTVAATWLGDGLHARLRTEGGQDYWIEPVPAEHGGVFGDHLFYATGDVVPHGGLCGLEDDIAPTGTEELGHGAPGAGTAGGSYAASGLLVAELGCDADFEYFQSKGSSTANVMNRITSVINTMNLQYEAQVGLTHQITTILVRTSSNNPYSSTNASTLLNQFRSEWNANQGAIQRDVAQLFTGKNIQGGTIGIAWLGGVCNSFGYSVVESDFNGAFACATDLSAHELGHNWNANHCSCSTTMNSFITCANSFGNASINAIVNFANAVGCLSSGTCGTQATTALWNGSGVNALCLSSDGPPVTGSNWTISIDTSSVPGATASIVLGRAQQSSGTFLGSNEILINQGSAEIFASMIPGGGGVNDHVIFIDPSLLGQSVTVQGGIRAGGPPPTLCNAETAVIGCAP